MGSTQSVSLGEGSGKMVLDKLCFSAVILIFLIHPSYLSPIVTDFDANAASNPFIPSNFCLLPPELGYTGEVKFIEDCPSLGRYETIPLPGDFYRKLGTHPVVCCPQLLPNSSICFESDAWCLNYKAPVKLTDEQIAQLQNPQSDNDGFEL